MHCENAIYDEVEAIEGRHEVVVKRNESYGYTKTSSDNCPKCKSSVEKNSSSKKAVIAVALAFAVLVLLLVVVAAVVGYALAEIFKLKSAMKDESARMSASFDTKFQQLQSISNTSAEVLNARISQVQITSQNETAMLDIELRNLSSLLSVALAVESCDDLPTSFPDGDYYILSASGSPEIQYCSSLTTQCGQTGRWRSVANLDMTNTSHQCPIELIENTYSNKALCVRRSDCSSIFLSATTAYKSVCGRVGAYQFGQPEAFHSSRSIDSTYVDGISITHGSPRQHIWSLAASYSPISSRSGCPCMGGSDLRPPFVGNDYFCDIGSLTGIGSVFYDDNPLWDGVGCETNNTCCSFNTPPWFYKELPQYAYDSIELRVCCDQPSNNEDIALESIEMYVK